MPATTDSTTLTIAFALLGFLLGFLLAALFYRRQVKRQKAEVVAQMSAVQGTLSSRERDLEALREEQATRDNDVQVAQQEAMELNARLAALTAELEELYTGTVEMEDRMNAAEARVLSAEAEMEQDRADLNQWSSAYRELKTDHAQLISEYSEIQSRRIGVEAELNARRAELEAVRTRLVALQSARVLQLGTAGGTPDTLQETVAAITLAKAETETELRRREMELTDLRSQLASTQFSINILTSSAAQLAAQVSGFTNEVEPPTVGETTPQLPRGSNEELAEELANLHSIIGEWYREIEPSIPYDPRLLLLFGGTTASVRTEADAEKEAANPPDVAVDLDWGDAGAQPGYRQPVQIPPEVMLAAIKATATSGVERGLNRQYELIQALSAHKIELAELSARVHAWRTMLLAALADDAEVLQLLDEVDEGSTADVLSASATVALTAYQRKQEALARAKSEASRALQPPTEGTIYPV